MLKHKPPAPSVRGDGVRLNPELARRLHAICLELLETRYGGNISAFSRDLGRAHSGVRRILEGTCAPSPETIDRLAELLQVEKGELYRVPSASPESLALPTPRTQTLSAIQAMARSAHYDSAFVEQWIPTNPEERDPDVLWGECKAAFATWKRETADSEADLERRRLTWMYIEKVGEFGRRLAERFRDPTDKELTAAVRQVYLDATIPPDLVLSVSMTAIEARARHPKASPIARAEYCFRADIIAAAKRVLANAS